MFEKSEQFYDAIYAWKDYQAEAARLQQLIAAHKLLPGQALLDVACGTGAHIPHLRDTFAIEGVDLDPRSSRSRRRNIQVFPLHHGDMVDFDLGRQFDVVVSLFSSVGYVRTADRLALAVANMARHVRPGGVLIIEPFFSPAAWKPRTRAPGANVVDQPDITIVRMSDWMREGNLAVSTFHYLVVTSAPARATAALARSGKEGHCGVACLPVAR